MNENKFSLILCTIGKTEFLKQFLIKISQQNYHNFEIIIVDQNQDQRVDKIISNYKQLSIKHIKSKKGLSRARNIGLKEVTGDIVAFPDDDCIYPVDLLEKVNNYLIKNKNDFLLIKMKNSNKNGRKVQEGIKSKYVNLDNMFVLGASISIFLKVNTMKRLEGFDEKLGLGADSFFQSVEDIDLVGRAIKLNIPVYFENSLEVLHPFDDIEIDKSKKLDERSLRGGAAEMYLLNKLDCGKWLKIKRILRRISILIYYMLKMNFYKFRLSFKILQGNCLFFSSKKCFFGENE